jgi:dienelactone hydrolase
VNDLMNILRVIQALPYADAHDIFMSGESRGAMMVYQAIRNDFPMRAAAVWGGFTDLGKLFEAMPGLIDYAAQNWPGFDPTDPSADIERRSAILWPDKFGVPVLLMHGERDDSIPVEHTYDLARALQSRNRLYGLIVFADDNHILSRSQLERDRATVRWFRRFSTEAIARMFESLRTDASERELISQGYSLLERGNMDKAIEVFQIGVNRFPKSANAFDSLGEAFAVAGDLRDAIDCYQQALSLESDPAERERIEAILATLESRLAE